MRWVMQSFAGGWDSINIPGRKRPLYYQHRTCRDVVVLGHYESTCGGCDNIGSARMVFEVIRDLLAGTKPPKVILAEGLLLSEDVKWSSQMADLTCYFLTTPTEKCLEQVKSRRLAAGNEKELNPENTVHRVDVIERARVKLTTAGIACRRCPADQAFRLILDRLRLHAEGG